jgi:hypothetical protein
VYETTFVNTAVASLSDAVSGIMEQAIPRAYSCKSKLLPWFSHTLRIFLIIFTTDSHFTGNLFQTPTSPAGLGG